MLAETSTTQLVLVNELTDAINYYYIFSWSVLASMDSRQRSTPKALQEEPEKLSMREIFAKTYRDNPPDFTVKRDIANKYGVTYFFIMITAQYYSKFPLEIYAEANDLT